MGVYAVGGFFLFIVIIYAWHLLMGKNVNLKDYKVYLSLIIGTVCGCVINFYLPFALKLILMVLLMFIINYFFFCKNSSKSLLIVIVTEFMAIFYELLVAIVAFLFVGNNAENILNSFNGTLLISLGVPILLFVFFKTKIPFRLYDYLYKTFNNMKQSNLIIYFIATLILISVFFLMTYMDLPKMVVLISNTVLGFFYVIIILKLANIQENYRKINSKYETSISSLKEYEDIMDKYRIANHENKNQLLTIRNMVKTDDKTVPNYIDNLIDNKIKDNENIFYKTSKIPEGGLRATIYSKVCKMDELGINYTLDIANDVRTVDLINLGENIILDVCKIIGVFLDNAIEAVEKLDKKEIVVELFVMDSCLCIDISNNYDGSLDINEIEATRYTTKGDGHGYGLSLVNDILKCDKALINEKSINRDRFTQRLKIRTFDF